MSLGFAAVALVDLGDLGELKLDAVRRRRMFMHRSVQGLVW